MYIMRVMKQFAEKVILYFYNVKTMDVKDCGGGYYGKVFLAHLSKAPFRAIVFVRGKSYSWKSCQSMRS